MRTALSKVVRPELLLAGMKDENGDENGIYTRQYLTCCGTRLADGARAAAADALLTGNAQAAAAAMTGWERLTRSHGSACGALHCDDTVAGLLPTAPISAEAAGAWCEALAQTMTRMENDEAADAVEKLVTNALPAAVRGGRIREWLYENTVGAEEPAFHTGDSRTAERLARGAAAVWENAVTMSPDSLQVNLLLPGSYTARVAGGRVRLTIADNGTIAVDSRAAGEWTLRIRVPAWAAKATVLLHGKKAEVRPGSRIAMKRQWKTGDTVTCGFESAVRTETGYHQAVTVWNGPVLMTLPVTRKQVMALCGAPVRTEKGVTVKAAAMGGASAGRLPVSPELKGSPAETQLVPFAEAKSCQTVLPVGKNA